MEASGSGMVLGTMVSGSLAGVGDGACRLEEEITGDDDIAGAGVSGDIFKA